MESLPVEIRLEIHNHLLNINNVPRNYAYTSAYTKADSAPQDEPSSTKPLPLRRHGMLLVNKKLSTEYRQAFYERTQFFLHIDPTNSHHSPFWPLSPSLLPNLRNCKLYIEFADILHLQEARLKTPRSRSTRSKPTRGTQTQTQTGSGPQDQLSLPWTSLSDCPSQFTAAAFQASFASRIFALLAQMGQLREMHFVWNVPCSCGAPTQASEGRGAVWSVQAIARGDEALREEFIETFKGMRLLRGGIVAMGTTVWRGRREGRGWVEEEF